MDAATRLRRLLRSVATEAVLLADAHAWTPGGDVEPVDLSDERVRARAFAFTEAAFLVAVADGELNGGESDHLVQLVTALSGGELERAQV